MKMKTCIVICGIVLGVMIVYVRHRKQNKQSEQTEQGLLTERTDQASNSILDKIKELFKTDSKFHVPVNGPEFVEVLRLMDIVDYFKSLKLRKGHDIPFVANAETCDTDKVIISSITMKGKSDNVEELSEATVNGKNINLNLSMSELGDNIEYKFVVENDSNEDYELDKTSINLNTDYVNYSFETEDNSNVVKAKSSKNVTLRVEYKNEVPEDQFENGTYNDNKTMTVQLSNNISEAIKNPKTGVQSYILLLVILLLVSGSLYIVFKKKKYTKFLILIIGCGAIVPIGVYALCKCDINIESKVVINKVNVLSIDLYCSYLLVFNVPSRFCVSFCYLVLLWLKLE